MPARTFLRFFLVVGFSQITLSACATTEQQTAQSAPVYYSDCGQISLDGKDGRNLTREELIAAEEQALFDALDDAGFALYSKELNPQWPNGIYELSLIKLAPAYWNERSAAEPGP